MTRYLYLIVVATFALSCGKADPQQSAYDSFKDFVAKSYEDVNHTMLDGKGKIVCKIKEVDVEKTNSASSPYVGILQGFARIDSEDHPLAPSPDHHNMDIKFKLKFKLKDGKWTCIEDESTTTGPFSACGSADSCERLE